MRLGRPPRRADPARVSRPRRGPACRGRGAFCKRRAKRGRALVVAVPQLPVFRPAEAVQHPVQVHRNRVPPAAGHLAQDAPLQALHLRVRGTAAPHERARSRGGAGVGPQAPRARRQAIWVTAASSQLSGVQEQCVLTGTATHSRHAACDRQAHDICTAPHSMPRVLSKSAGRQPVSKKQHVRCTAPTHAMPTGAKPRAKPCEYATETHICNHRTSGCLGVCWHRAHVGEHKANPKVPGPVRVQVACGAERLPSYTCTGAQRSSRAPSPRQP